MEPKVRPIIELHRWVNMEFPVLTIQVRTYSVPDPTDENLFEAEVSLLFHFKMDTARFANEMGLPSEAFLGDNMELVMADEELSASSLDELNAKIKEWAKVQFDKVVEKLRPHEG